MIDPNFVILGALLSLIGSLNYVINTIKGNTKPNRATWFLWALAPLIATGAMLSEGVTWQGTLMTFMVGFGPLLVFISSFVNKKSIWKLKPFDYICGSLSVVGTIFWFVTRTGEVAIFFSIIADTLALLPTLVKAWRHPETESWLVFLFASINSLITLLTIKNWDLTHAGFPIYIFISCTVLFIVIRFGIGPKIVHRSVRS